MPKQNKLKLKISQLRQQWQEKRTLQLPNGKVSIQPINKMPFIVAGFVVAIVLSLMFTITQSGLSAFFRNFSNFFYLIGRMFQPDFSILPSVWQPLLETIGMTFIGSFVGALLAIPGAFLAASNITHNKVVVGIMRFIFGLVRTIPTLVVAIIAAVVVGLGSLAATIAIILFTFSFIGKLLYQQIETVDMGPYEAMLAMGCTKVRAFRAAIVPQVLPSFLANSLYCFEGNIRYSTILGYAGAGGLGLLLMNKIAGNKYEQVGAILLVLFVVVAIIEITSRICRKKLS